VIVFRTDRRVAGGRVFLLLDYGHFWDYPKGHVENGEDDLAAALRELSEETGITDATLVEGFRHELSYFFRDKKSRLIRKSVVFFLARARPGKIKISHEHAGGEFLPYAAALKRLTYPNAKAALKAAEAFLANGGGSAA
jgi:8-oxo-dGTP pyrophosphatase MutT (NUDIX family)